MTDEPTFILDEPVTDISAVNGSKSITVKATKGKFKVVVEGDETGDVKFDATAEELSAALDKLGSVDVGDIAVTGGPGDATGTKPYVLKFAGQYAGANVPTITTIVTGLEEGTKTATVATVTVGADENPDAVQRGEGLADREGEESPLTDESPAEIRAENGSTYGDA